MGIITRIEDKLGNIVENPFREKNGLDLLGIEICLKRLIELKRRNILGKVVVPNFLTIIINRKNYEEYEPFFDTFKNTLTKNLDGWTREKGYELAGQVELKFSEAFLKNKPFEAFVSYKKANGCRGNNDKTDLRTSGQKDTGNRDKIIVGELVNKKTGKRFKVNQNTMIIGRGEDCLIRINDPTVSRKHASLSYQHGKVILEDLESKCGTWVNHQKISKQILRQGDRIIIGGTEFTFIALWKGPGESEYDLPSDGETKGTSLETSDAESKINSSNPNLWGLSYFF